MGGSYERLWIMLIQRKMNKSALREKAGLTTAALAHMGKGEPVTMEALGKICKTLDCRLEDIVEYVPEA